MHATEDNLYKDNRVIIYLLAAFSQSMYLYFLLLQLRFQKCVDAHPEIMQKVAVTEQEKLKEKVEKDKCEKDKVS